VGKKAIGSFPVCLPCCLHVCTALISFSLSDRTGTNFGTWKSMIYEILSYSQLLANNLNFLVQQQISMAENVITCNSYCYKP